MSKKMKKILILTALFAIVFTFSANTVNAQFYGPPVNFNLNVGGGYYNGYYGSPYPMYVNPGMYYNYPMPYYGGGWGGGGYYRGYRGGYGGGWGGGGYHHGGGRGWGGGGHGGGRRR